MKKVAANLSAALIIELSGVGRIVPHPRYGYEDAGPLHGVAPRYCFSCTPTGLQGKAGKERTVLHCTVLA
jgi:hypothetical protein